MFRYVGAVLTLGILLGVNAPVVYAAEHVLNYDDGEIAADVTTVTVGTTTYNIEFARATLENAQAQLQQILYYLRNFDAAGVNDDVQAIIASTTPPFTNIYNDIADLVFGEEGAARGQQQSQTTALIANSIAFIKDFDEGIYDAEVVKIQKFLNQFPDTRVAEEGPGSPGYETNYFGARTLAAVRKFQEKHADKILIPLGLTRGTGYWGKATREYANKLLVE